MATGPRGRRPAVSTRPGTPRRRHRQPLQHQTGGAHTSAQHQHARDTAPQIVSECSLSAKCPATAEPDSNGVASPRSTIPALPPLPAPAQGSGMEMDQRTLGSPWPASQAGSASERASGGRPAGASRPSPSQSANALRTVGRTPPGPARGRDARRMSATVPGPAFASARVRRASAVV